VSPLSEQASGDRLFYEMMTQYVSVAAPYICSVSGGSIDENNDSVSHGIVAKLTSAAEYFRCRSFSQTVWWPYL